ncbi:hypothetical protein AN401_11725 [Zobellella denitrificans]|uniref:Mu-like prophage protein gp37 n=1 Tax=Zobellella denitrificans TaxID=347534 RepID=A0A291HQK6_9GAMM|nr:phage protein Gp37 [Zobellella denitrificans]ATG74440.1 hypothetical protein AN401_11725 [Zobellella denitrificans]
MIADAEQQLLAAVRDTLGATVKRVESHPGHWDDDAVRRLVQTPPSVYLAFLGGRPGRRPDELDAQWAMFVTARVLNGQRELGIYQLLERLVARFNGQRVAGCGFTLRDIKNLWSDTQSGAGVAVYGLYWQATMTLPSVVDLTTLDEFQTHYQTWPRGDAATVDQQAHITLESNDG